MEENILGKRIKELRESKDVSQLELSKHLNISNTTLSQYETGKRIPSDEIKIKIAQYFNVSIDYLFGQSNIKNPYANNEKIDMAISDDSELSEFWNTLKEREDLKLLFKQSKDSSPSVIKKMMRIIKAIEEEEDRNDG